MSKIVNLAAPKTITIGTHDAVSGEDLIKNITTQVVFIPTSVNPTSSAPAYLDDYPAGTLAIAYGGGAVYQKDNTGDWVAFS